MLAIITMFDVGLESSSYRPSLHSYYMPELEAKPASHSKAIRCFLPLKLPSLPKITITDTTLRHP